MKDNVPMEVKKERLQRLNTLVNTLAIEKNSRYKGQIVEVLVDGESKNNPEVLAGYTRTNKLVNFCRFKIFNWSACESKNNGSKNLVS